MEKLSLNLRSLMFALCLTGCLQALAVPGKRASRFPDLRTFLKEHFQAHSQSPSREWPAPFAKGLAREKSKGFAPALTSEDHEIVTPPAGLVTEDYTLVSQVGSSDDKEYSQLWDGDHLQTLQVGFDGSDIYIKGMSSIFPDAWIKGTLSEDQKTVKIPTPQYIGSRVGEDGESVDWFFEGYNYENYGDNDNNFFVNYNNEDGSFSISIWDEFYERDIYGSDWITLYYPQIVKDMLNDDVVTPPSGLATKDYMLKGKYWNGDTIQIPLKVGFYQDDVYVRGLFPGLPDAWIEGKLSGNEITFPKWQCLGESDEISQLMAEQSNLVEIESKKLYLFGLDLENYTTSDLVVKYDEVNGTMTGDVMVVGLSRTNLRFIVHVTQGFAITPISEKAATPSAPEISAFTIQDGDIAFSFNIPFMGTEGEGLVTDNLCYRILTENAGNISTVSFNPADYETLQETMSLVPYGFSDKKYFTPTYNYDSGKTENKVILKRSQFDSLNKIGVQSVYHGGGTTNESDVSWFTIENAINLLYEEINIAYNYLNDYSNPLGRDDLQSAYEIASNLYYELSSMDEEAFQSYNIIYILDAIQSLKTAEKVFLQRNANCDERVIQLASEINDAYNLFYDEQMPYGKEELLAAISHAEQLRDEIASLDEEALKEYDMSIVDDEITALQEAKQIFMELNEKEHDYIADLQSEISNAYSLLDYDSYNYGRDAFYNAISHAEELLNEYYYLDEEERQEFDMSIITEEIWNLQEAEEQFTEFNDKVSYNIHILSSGISEAYDLYYDNDLKFDKGILWEAISHANHLLSDIYDMDDETIFNFDFSVVPDEVDSLRVAVRNYVTINTIINEDEWQTLKAYCQSANPSEWLRTWDFSSSTRSRKSLPGVSSYNGHVLTIDLSSNNINAPFPYEFLKLPNLEMLILSDNKLVGDLGKGMTQFLEPATSVSSSIKRLDISRNQLSGNIGTIANALTGLDYLNASENRFDEVSPVIPNSVYLDLYHQDIQNPVDLHLSEVDEGTLLQHIPNILLYNHESQSYMSVLHLEFNDNQGENVGVLLRNDSFEFDKYKYLYTGESGDLLSTIAPSNSSYSYNAKDVTLPVRLYFDQGDADFNGRIDILDLQKQIECIVEDYYSAINFTAANLWKDETINVQDAVCMVNLLLDRNPSIDNAGRLIKQKERQQADEGNSVFLCDGKLFLSTTSPVAAFDIVVSSDNEMTLCSELKKHGLTCSVKKTDGQTHMVGYSLSGGTLPEGLTEIGGGLYGEVVYAMVAGKDAHEIPVSLNNIPTDIVKSTTDMGQDDIKYIIPLGTKHALFIDSNGKKTIREKNK